MVDKENIFNYDKKKACYAKGKYMEESKITIKAMTDYKNNIRQEVCNIFIDAYYEQLKAITNSKEILNNLFISAFQKEFFYIAELNHEIVGILACTTNKKRAMIINKSTFQKNLGLIKGSLFYFFLKSDFNRELPYPIEVGYIECIATKPSARGKGVATTLLQEVIKHLLIKQYYLEVVDTNQNALRIYRKLGFYEIYRKKTRFSKIKGSSEKICMELKK